jgi:hypothetical protein
MSERQFRRYRDRYEAEGWTGLCDRGWARRRPAGSERDREEMLELYRGAIGLEREAFPRAPGARPRLCWGYTWTKTQLHTAGLVAAGEAARGAPAQAAAQAVRRHDAAPGRLAPWLAGGAGPLDLIVTMDDATSTIYSAFLVEEEGTASSFQGAVGDLCRPRACRRASTPIAAATTSTRPRPASGRQGSADPGRPGARPARHRAHPGLFAGGARALGAHVRHAAGSPAQGARACRDHRHRGRQPLHREVYLPAHNARFARPPEIADSAFVAADPALCRDPVRGGGAGGLPRQHRRLRPGAAATAAKARLRPTTSRPASRCASIPTARSPSSTGRAASPATTPKAARSSRPHHEGCRVNRFDAQPQQLVDLWTAAARPPTSPHKPATNNRSGHLMCYQNRTIHRKARSGRPDGDLGGKVVGGPEGGRVFAHDARGQFGGMHRAAAAPCQGKLELDLPQDGAAPARREVHGSSPWNGWANSGRLLHVRLTGHHTPHGAGRPIEFGSCDTHATLRGR